jgi:hypothetical protein
MLEGDDIRASKFAPATLRHATEADDNAYDLGMLIPRNNNPPVYLITINDRHCVLQDYKCSSGEAERFAGTFRQAIHRLPRTALDVLNTDWARANGPRVWLPRRPGAWGGRGWAASRKAGQEFLFVAQIVTAIPSEHLQTFVAHECGHALCCMVGEPAHAAAQDFVRVEWLNWQLMRAWGFDQPAAELWAYRNVDGRGDEPQILDAPLDEEEARQKRDGQRQRLLEKLVDTSIPDQLRTWLPEQVDGE